MDYRQFTSPTPAGREKRQAIRAAKQRRIILALALCFALVLLIFFILLISGIVDAVRGDDTLPDDPIDQPGDTQEDPENPGDSNDPNAGEDEPAEDPNTTYVSMPATAVRQGTLLLVNDTHEYLFPTAGNSNLINIFDSQSVAKTRSVYYQLSGSKLLMDKTAYGSLNKMLVAFSEATTKTDVLLDSAYRSYEDQEMSGSSVRPGYSDTHIALSCALRVMTNQGKKTDLSSDPVYNWIYENCYKYGFVVRYPDGKETLTNVSDYNYYFRYVGYVHAYTMNLNDMCLEEYIPYVQRYTKEEPLSVNADDGITYEIYYVPANTDGTDTSVPVPVTEAYEISGDNEGGFIVTVTKS